MAVYLIFPILWYVYNQAYRIYRYLFIVVCIFVLGAGTLSIIDDIIALRHSTSIISVSIDFLNLFNPLNNGWYLFYFMLGGVIYRHLDWIREKRIGLAVFGVATWILAFLIGFCLSMSNGELYNPDFNYRSVFLTGSFIGLFAYTLPYEADSAIKRFIGSIGQNTFGMYLSHYLFIFTINHFVVLQGFKTHFLAYCVVCVGSYVFSIIVKRIPGLKKIVEI